MSEIINATEVHKDGEPTLIIGIRTGKGVKIAYEAPLCKIQDSAGGDITVECDIKLNPSSKMPGIIVSEKLKNHEERIKTLEGIHGI